MSGNTLDAHRLLLWAQRQGDAQPLLGAMYRAHFEQADSIFGNENLLVIALEAGFDASEVEKVLASDVYASDVEADQAKAASLGANGVPFFVIDGKFGISGAQPISTFSDVLVKASS
ncbi:DSBA-like thioredoxin domain protein [mine drainage metagenome]|uniref:DSBA-like thioredoxin domain protein n=1 Tax=mine drainage metagenome TaxID=410659 RepID=A0A1J5PPG3_9ZZZZ